MSDCPLPIHREKNGEGFHQKKRAENERRIDARQYTGNRSGQYPARTNGFPCNNPNESGYNKLQTNPAMTGDGSVLQRVPQVRPPLKRNFMVCLRSAGNTLAGSDRESLWPSSSRCVSEWGKFPHRMRDHKLVLCLFTLLAMKAATVSIACGPKTDPASFDCVHRRFLALSIPNTCPLPCPSKCLKQL